LANGLLRACRMIRGASVAEKTTCMLNIAAGKPHWAVAALAAIVRIGRVGSLPLFGVLVCIMRPAALVQSDRVTEAAAEDALLHAQQLTWMGGNPDDAVLACLSKYSARIGALMQRQPGLLCDLHAEEPWAGVSLVMSLLRTNSSLPGSCLPVVEQQIQKLRHMFGAAEHMLE
jgi:hypothetical protein